MSDFERFMARYQSIIWKVGQREGPDVALIVSKCLTNDEQGEGSR